MTATENTEGDGKSPYAEESIDKLRGGARRIKADLEDLADALEDGTAEPADVYNVINAISATYVDVEDAAHDAGAIDTETPAVRAANEARKVLYHIGHDDDSAAISAATAAAEYAELARDGEEAEDVDGSPVRETVATNLDGAARVCVPEEFALEPGDTIEIEQRDGEIVLRRC